MRTVLNGHIIRVVEDHCSRVINSNLRSYDDFALEVTRGHFHWVNKANLFGVGGNYTGV